MDGDGLLLLAGSLLGSLEGVDLEIFRLDLDLDMGGEIADPIAPFLYRCGIGAADSADGPLDDTLTTLTIINYNLTGTVRKYTSLFPPESTLAAGKNRLTLHEESLLLFFLRVAAEFKCTKYAERKSTGKIR
jgi:hypothetical protein